MIKILAICLACSTLAGCGTIMNWIQIEPKGTVTNTDSFCLIAQPILWSKNDTPDTIEQIKELNAVGKHLCGWGKKP